MDYFRSVAGIPKRQLKNVRNVLTRRPLTSPSLGSVTLDQDDIDLARAALRDRSRWYEPEETATYEEAFARWNGSKAAFALMGGRVALSACLHALGLKEGDEVIVPGYTCVVVANAFLFAGVKAVYSDIELESYGLDADPLEKKITSRTRAVVVQHLYGLVSRDYEAVIDLARRKGLFVIEDCAHATGAEFKGIKVGNCGDVAIYSGEQSKVFTTIHGGFAVANDESLIKGLRAYKEKAPYPDETWIERQLHTVILNYYLFKHPQRWWRGDLARIMHGRYRVGPLVGDEMRGVQPEHYGRKMPAPIAAIGMNQLGKIDEYNERRRRNAERWHRWCDENGYKRPLVIEGSVPVYLRYPVLVEPEKKQDFSWAKKTLNVTPGVWYESHIHPTERPVEGCPNADKAIKSCINFPCLLD
ncbi:MAG: aminotransferase class I/II-fold pyridoxal phosphate-dependent enzyme [Candidatus Latescibacteria bacterium]|nr:aminotransferase class I/II-fold pyridoxal phosphate-dependent enzyme [Candidatus Latescibacterota bacterium]NIM64415.1 aminotransferase class I/II-fold pyridoxal phosphate-dependent enzyme [Candidatus Latescibacterota bacterium]NIO00569.1 aminotransferase class I/II-fold pyridoxal phosphate-dependent enzyme [Candidatus Latescibacterota bacterium]NIO26969.1 aminotransferase class I/II-fold pyridoxal phosphate-dependent enzyme [Candidatus Latescibacterota bacterium]NIO56046.1 aminotransferase